MWKPCFFSRYCYYLSGTPRPGLVAAPGPRSICLCCCFSASSACARSTSNISGNANTVNDVLTIHKALPPKLYNFLVPLIVRSVVAQTKFRKLSGNISVRPINLSVIVSSSILSRSSSSSIRAEEVVGEDAILLLCSVRHVRGNIKIQKRALAMVCTANQSLCPTATKSLFYKIGHFYIFGFITHGSTVVSAFLYSERYP